MKHIEAIERELKEFQRYLSDRPRSVYLRPDEWKPFKVQLARTYPWSVHIAGYDRLCGVYIYSGDVTLPKPGTIIRYIGKTQTCFADAERTKKQVDKRRERLIADSFPTKAKGREIRDWKWYHIIAISRSVDFLIPALERFLLRKFATTQNCPTKYCQQDEAQIFDL